MIGIPGANGYYTLVAPARKRTGPRHYVGGRCTPHPNPVPAGGGIHDFHLHPQRRVLYTAERSHAYPEEARLTRTQLRRERMMVQDTSESRLTRRFEDALIFAHHLHATQKRKGTAIPYMAHLLS